MVRGADLQLRDGGGPRATSTRSTSGRTPPTSSAPASPTPSTGPRSPPLKLYHTLEYIPSFEDFAGDYLLNLAAGAKVKITKGFFADFRLEWLYDSTPASGREKVDTRYILAVGWEF